MTTREDQLAARLAQRLAEYINPALPDGFRVTADDSDLLISSSSYWLGVGGYDLRQHFDPLVEQQDGDEVMPGDLGDERMDRLTSAIESFLSTTQDDISEALTVPWPQERSADRFAMAMPFTIRRQRVVHFGYGDPENPTVDLGAIDLGEFL